MSDAQTAMQNKSLPADNYLNIYRYKSKFLSWILSTDHKRIGLLYLFAMFSFFFVAVILGLLMRLELLTLGETIMDAQTYNQFFTLHGVIMIFLFIVPGIPAVLGNFLLPLQIGAEDVAFPRLNLASWWVYMFGAIFAILSLVIGLAPPDTGWTFYVPYSMTSGTNVAYALLAAFILGWSSILTGINFITTIHRLQAKGMTFFKMPLFVWGIYATSWIQLLATPVVGITLIMVIFERWIGIGIFDPSMGGDPILYQHLFWIYSHPAVYIMILPAMGIVSEILPVFSRKPIFGYKAIAMSSMAIALVGYLVWGHHMFTAGMADTAQWIFSLLTFLVAVPSGIKIFNWIATMYKGSIHLRAPLIYTLMFIILFSIGGLTGLVLGSIATDVHLHDTYFVVAHFHYVMFGGTAIMFFAGIHYWLPKMTGRMYNERLANISAGIIFVGFNMLYFTMFIMGYMGMPRRYYDSLPEFLIYHQIATVGSWILVAGMLLMAWNLIRSVRKGDIADANPWKAATLEWKTSSPPPLLNFNKKVEMTHGPYDYEALEREES
jgi:cytochrome c oxidase subunit 1